jgi:hypothetical protein
MPQAIPFASPGGSVSGAVQYRDASGQFAGSSTILVGASGLIVPVLYPSADSTTAVKICKADGTTAVVTVDTTNTRVGILTAGPAAPLHILTGGSALAPGSNTTLEIQNTSAAGSSVRIQAYSGTTGSFILDMGDTADADVGELIYSHSSNYMSFVVNASERVRIDSSGNFCIGTTTATASKATIEGTISLKEQAAADADTAAYGQIWVGNTTPNELWFTDDAGTDTQISPHPKDAPADLYTLGPGYDLIDKRVYHYKGEIHWTKPGSPTVVESFTDYNVRTGKSLQTKDWDAKEQARLTAAEKKRTQWQGDVAAYRTAVAKWQRLPWALRGELPGRPGDEPPAYIPEANPFLGA